MNSLIIAKSLLTLIDNQIPKEIIADALVIEAEEKNATYLIPHILNHLDNLIIEDNNNKTLKLSVPFETKLTETFISKLRDKLDAPKDVKVEIQNNCASALAGFMAEFNNYLYDARAIKMIKDIEESIKY